MLTQELIESLLLAWRDAALVLRLLRSWVVLSNTTSTSSATEVLLRLILLFAIARLILWLSIANGDIAQHHVT